MASSSLSSWTSLQRKCRQRGWFTATNKWQQLGAVAALRTQLLHHTSVRVRHSASHVQCWQCHEPTCHLPTNAQYSLAPHLCSSLTRAPPWLTILLDTSHTSRAMRALNLTAAAMRQGRHHTGKSLRMEPTCRMQLARSCSHTTSAFNWYAVVWNHRVAPCRQHLSQAKQRERPACAVDLPATEL